MSRDEPEPYGCMVCAIGRRTCGCWLEPCARHEAILGSRHFRSDAAYLAAIRVAVRSMAGIEEPTRMVPPDDVVPASGEPAVVLPAGAPKPAATPAAPVVRPGPRRFEIPFGKGR